MSKNNMGFDFSQVSVMDILDPQDNDPMPGEGSQNPQLTEDTTTDDETGSGDPNQGSEPDTQQGNQEPGNDVDQNEPGGQEDADGDGAGEGDGSQEGDGEGEGEGDGGEQGTGEDGDDQTTVIEEVSQLLGFEVEGEFEDNVEGIAQFTSKVGEKMGEQYLLSIFEQFPDVKEFLEYRANGGDPNTYFGAVKQEVEFSALSKEDIEKDPELQKTVVREMYTKMGYTRDEISEAIRDLEDSELLAKQATVFGEKLKQQSKAEKDQILAQQAAQQERRRKEEQETLREIANTIKGGNLKGIVIPENSKQAFYDWMTKPVDAQGNTQRMLDMQKMDNESSLALEYLFYTGMDFSNVLKGKGSSQTSKTRQLRDRLRTKSGSVKSTLNRGSKGGHQRPVTIPGLNELL